MNIHNFCSEVHFAQACRGNDICSHSPGHREGPNIVKHCVTSMSKLSNTRLSMAQARYLNTYCVWQIFGPLHTWSIFARFSRLGSQALVALNKLWSANGFGEAWLGQQYYCWVWWLLLGSWAGPRLSQLWMIPNIIWKSFVRSFLSLCCRGPTLIALPDPYLGFKPA